MTNWLSKMWYGSSTPSLASPPFIERNNTFDPSLMDLYMDEYARGYEWAKDTRFSSYQRMTHLQQVNGLAYTKDFIRGACDSFGDQGLVDFAVEIANQFLSE